MKTRCVSQNLANCRLQHSSVGAEKPCLPVCRRQAKPHAQRQKCVDGIGNGTVKSDWSIVVLHHFGLGRSIGFQAAVSDTSDGKHPESLCQLIVT